MTSRLHGLSRYGAGFVLAGAALLARPATAQQVDPREIATPAANLFGDRAGLFLSGDPLASENAPPVTTQPKRFLPAAAGVVLLEVGPWAFDRYVNKEGFSYISFDTIKENFKTGFKYDRDSFRVNQSSHPYHGGLFFDSARSNGYSYWESGLFSMAGSLIWECCMENTPPSINDFVNTTLGGIDPGRGRAPRVGSDPR